MEATHLSIQEEFLSPRRKLRRARFHISSLDEAVQAYQASIRYEPVVERLSPAHGGIWDRWARRGKWGASSKRIPPQYGRPYIHKIRILTTPPESLDEIAGDAVQNLRQALDHAVCSCARATGKTDRGVWFPLVGEGADLEEAIKDKARKLPETVRDIIRTAAPSGGLLYELHNLSVIDKHRLICGVGLHGGSSLAYAHALPGASISMGFDEDEWDPIANEIRYALSRKPHAVSYEFQLRVDVRFNGSGRISDGPAPAVLSEIADLVEQVVDQIEVETTRLEAAHPQYE